MAKLMDLPSELLSIIITFLAMCSHGGRDLVRASATCKVLLNLARRPEILRVTNCQKVMLRCFGESHHHIDGLLSRCVRAGNPTAEHVLAMTILLGESQLWTKIMVSELQQQSIECAMGMSLLDRRSIIESFKTGSIADVPYILFCSEDKSYRLMQPLRLLRLFISRASSRQLLTFCRRLKDFTVVLVGYERVHESGIVVTIKKMCLYENLLAQGIVARVEPSFRDELLEGFDRLFLAGVPM